jgi:AcrR family transcriptional regulator
MSSSYPDVDRPMRRDAVRNRRRVLDAARVIVAKRGEDAGVDEIAALAGVGVGTLYRSFPTKGLLLSALLDDLTNELITLAHDALERPDGLEDFLRRTGRLLSEQRGHLPRLWNREVVSAGLDTLRAAIGELLIAAQAGGQVSPDAALGDISVLLWAMRGIIETTGDVAPQAWERHLDIQLAGLRCSPLPSERAPISAEDASRISRTHARS